MKKMFLLIPVGLIAVGGFMLLSSQSSAQQSIPKAMEVTSKTPEQLFSLSQNSLSLILRHGDNKAISTLESSTEELEKVLPKYEKQGLNVDKLERLIVTYKEDSRVLSQTARPLSDKLHVYDTYEEENEEKFFIAIKQIGLYELKTDYNKLCRIRLDYLKEPSAELEEKYRLGAKALTQMIQELYLDDAIEDPLYAYIDNHKNYFETVSKNYQQAGMERVHRVRQNSYAIKTELQMLPSL
ncbi:MAG: hypothetical protein A3I60_05295 [Sulfuricurvum sp. RIFCSPLOWO2_02_FULL_43_45]|nr:MAG: hypothetical protein A3D90_08325 [Sulfuricurvum sp. RIFCSPHIGHO2_02_FULL_43_9]OHD85816.1 MAG: hypothetical protein A3I60_05295 [Sulfuricurvum sp. RIFCSPLOWO2_02_FULL_43_45]OHD86879.1 MAG: hypothetical protein A2Y52_10075 [Sulfuricurvum sp. RIFCSPLOWO2_02_43_6]